MPHQEGFCMLFGFVLKDTKLFYMRYLMWQTSPLMSFMGKLETKHASLRNRWNNCPVAEDFDT